MTDETNAAVSPTKPKEVQVTNTQKIMDFYQALEKMLAGKKVTKLSWDNEKTYGFFNDTLMIRIDGELHKWLLKEADLEGSDYVVTDKFLSEDTTAVTVS